MKINLIKSVKADLLVIAKMYKTEMSKPPYNENWTERKAIEKMKFYSKVYDLFTIKVNDKENNQIAGFICINPKFMCPGEVAFGEEFVIKKEFQNKGIGAYVIKEIIRLYKKRGFKRLLGIANTKGKAIKLYYKLGVEPSKKDVLIERRLK